MQYNTVIVLIGTSLLGACSGLVGSFAVLRRRALVGDALAHAALPGICIAFLILDQRNLPAMLLGALICGVLGIAVIAGLRRATRIREDAAIGIVLSVFYGAGIVLSRIIQNRTTTGSKAGLESFILGKTAGMIREDIHLIAGAAVLCLALVVVLYKEFKVVSFDPAFSEVQGLPVFILDMGLMAMVAVTVVIGLPAVGVVLMAALLILPAAAARFWTEELGHMMLIAVGFGLVTGSVGTLISAHAVRLPAGPVIVLVGSAIFLVSVMFAPRRGAISRIMEALRLQRITAVRLALRRMYEHAESIGFADTEFSDSTLPRRAPGFLGHWQSTRSRLLRSGLVHSAAAGRIRFTASGWRTAVDVTRNHRLMRLYLDEHTDDTDSFADPGTASALAALSRETLDELTETLRQRGQWPRVPAAGEQTGGTAD